MAIPATTTMTVTDTLPGEEVEATIGDPKFVMQALSELYGDRITAFIREYSTNAQDAEMRLAADTGAPLKPIEVTLPTPMEPKFTVRDRGVGMSYAMMKKNYLSFGISDKRLESGSNGMLGFGSKSGVAYTTAFTVTSVHNGVKTTAVVRRREDWSIAMNMVQQKTDEANGTAIEIPIAHADVAEVCHKAREFFKFWLPGRVLVDGAEPDHMVGAEIVPGLYFSDQYATSYVVMGNVAYRINNPAVLFSGTNMNHVNFVAYVDNGEVDFTKSREDLDYTARTKDTLHRVISEFQTKIVEKAQSDIDSAPSHADAYLAWVNWCDRLGPSMFKNLTFSGDELTNTFPFTGKRYRVNGGRGNTYSIAEWQVQWSPQTLFVTDFTPELSSTHKAKAKAWAEYKGMERPNFILFTKDAKVDSVWVSQDRVVSWSTIKSELPKDAVVRVSNGRPRRIPGSFDYVTKSGEFTEQPLPSKGDVFYITVADSKRYNVKNILNHLDTDASVVILGQNRINKFTRENPTVKRFLAHAKKFVVIDAATLLSDEAKALLGIDSNTQRWARNLNLDRVDDPDFKTVKSLVERKDELLRAYKSNQYLAGMVGMRYTVKDYDEMAQTSLLTRYPLLADIDRYGYGRFHDHTYIYLNAAYAAQKGN